MSIELVPAGSPSVVITEEDSSVTINLEPSVIIEVGDSGIQPPRSNNIGVMYLKDNDIPTPIASTNARAVVSGTVQTGELVNFEKHSTTNSLRYLGESGKFLMIATFSFYEGSQKTCGFYIGVNRNIASTLSADADRISESEIYVNAGTQSNQPKAATVQTVATLNYNDRVFFIVQNKDAASEITVEFLKLIAGL
jgi:hypothetical protein